MAPVVATNGNTVQMADLEDSQVNANVVQTRANVGRLTNSLRNLKGQLTKEINNCYEKLHILKPYCPQLGWELLLSRLSTPREFWSATPAARIDLKR